MKIDKLIKEDFLTVEKDATLSSFIGKLREREKRNALIFDHGKFEGIIEDKWLMKSRMDAPDTLVSSFVKMIPTAEPDIEVTEAAYLMFQSDINILPISTNKHISGVVYGLDLAKEAMSLPEMKDLKVEALRIEKVPNLGADDPISHAMTIMYEKKVRHVPITKEMKLDGVISYSDILKRYYVFPAKRERSMGESTSTRAFESEAPEIDQLPVHNFATADPLTCKEDDKLRDAVDMMVEKDIHSLILVEDEKPKGVLTLKNILRKVASLNVPQNFNIQWIGLNETHLSDREKENIQKIASNEAFKLQRRFKNEFNLSIHLKEYEKEGKEDKQHKYAINLKVEYPGHTVQSHKGWGGTWVIETALRKAFENADNELKKKFRGDSSHEKEYE